MTLLEQGFREQAAGATLNRPRTRIPYSGGLLHYMAAALPEQGSVGMKAYLSTRRGTRFVALLWDSESGELLAILEADWLGRIRTGAASGVATRALAREFARVAGVVGAGGQAETQIEALAAARNLDEIKVFSRTPDSRESLARAMTERLQLPVRAVSSAEEAVRGSDVVTAITNAREPVFDGAWLEPGAHINAAGSNGANRREIDETSVARASIVAVDSLEQARIEAGDLIIAAEAGTDVWDRVVELGAVLTGASAGRTEPGEITLFESQGIALEDVIAARFVYDRAMESGRGTHIDFGGAPA